MTDVFAADLDASPPASPRPDANLDILSGVSLRVSVEVGSTAMRLADLLNVAEGSLIELDRQSNDLLDMFANGSLIARGEIVQVDNRYGIRIAEVVTPERRTPAVERRL